MKNKLLPEFQRYLRSKNLIDEKYIPFYAYWAREFLAFSKSNRNLSRDVQLQKFINHLTDQKNIGDWQVKQAKDAVQLYVNYSQDGSEAFSYPVRSQKTRTLSAVSKILADMQQALRIKHYAYQTELAYLEWVKKFYEYILYEYILNVKKKDVNVGLDSVDVRDYLSYLALKKRVAASTQNQAFNALIFLFQHVLKIELRDLNKTVRAKRGQRLPVVFTAEEVKELFKHINDENLLILKLIYGSGLRIMELVRLRVKDIDFGSNLIIVRNAKR